MSQDSKIITCLCCDYKTNKKYNLTRHMVRIHPQQNVTPLQQNVSMAQQNVSMTQQNVSMDNYINDAPFECELCNKIFNKHWVLIRHKKICNGRIDALTCDYCKKIFGKRASKSRHMKSCINNPQIQNITNNITNNIDNSTNTTNNNNNTTNNNTLNNTINVITYNPVYTELMPIVPKHVEKIKRMIKGSNTTNSKEIMRIIRQYADYSLDLYQNRFVIKNNLRSSYSRVHCGNNNWKHFVDSTILPQFTNSVMGSFQELFQESCDVTKHKFMNDYVDEMYSHGELKYDTPACKDYAVLLEELKLKIYDLTKDIGNIPEYYSRNHHDFSVQNELINS